MNKLSRMRRSRDSWKGKATSRAEQLREFRKTKARQQRRIEEFKERIATQEQVLLSEKTRVQPSEVVSIDKATQTRLVCVLLLVQAVVSFRAVPRILDLLREMEQLSLRWVPHFTSVINWTVRIGLAALNQVGPMGKPWLAIIDLSIDFGVKKLLFLKASLRNMERNLNTINGQSI